MLLTASDRTLVLLFHPAVNGQLLSSEERGTYIVHPDSAIFSDGGMLVFEFVIDDKNPEIRGSAEESALTPHLRVEGSKYTRKRWFIIGANVVD